MSEELLLLLVEVWALLMYRLSSFICGRETGSVRGGRPPPISNTDAGLPLSPLHELLFCSTERKHHVCKLCCRAASQPGHLIDQQPTDATRLQTEGINLSRSHDSVSTWAEIGG